MADSNLTIKIGSVGDFAAFVEARAQIEATRASIEAVRATMDAFGLSLGLAGIVEAGKHVLEYAGNIGRLSDQAQISTSSFQALSFAAISAGLSQGDLASRLEYLNKSMGLAAEGSSKQNAAIADLGLNTAQLLSMPVDAQLETIAKAYSTAADRGKAYADVVALLGRGTAQLQQVLQQLAEKGMDGLKAENAPWIISPEGIKATEESEVAMKRLGERLTAVLAIAANEALNHPGRLLGNAIHGRNAFYQDGSQNPIQSAPGGYSSKPGDLDNPIQSAGPDPAEQIANQMAETLAALPAMQAAHRELTQALQAEAGGYETLDQKAARLREYAAQDEAASKKMAGNPADFAAQVESVKLLTQAAKERSEANKDEALADQKYIKDTVKAANEDYETEKKRGEIHVQNLEMEEAAREKLMAVAMSAIDHNWNETDNQKWADKKALLESNVAGLQKYIDAQNQIANNPLNATEVSQKAKGAAGKAGNTLAGAQGQINGMGPDPQSFYQNFSADLTKLQTQWGTLQQNMASGLTGVINTALNSVESNISKLIMGTETWRKALMSIVTTIESSVVSSFIQMGVKWVATQIMMAVEGKATAAASAAAMIPIAMAESEVWAAPAALATIASWGGAAMAAPELVLASMAATQALAGFSQGGYTGDDGGIVHDHEYVFSAPAVRNIGLENLDRAHSMAKSGGGNVQSAAGGGKGVEIHMHHHNSIEEQIRAFHRNPANKKFLVDSHKRFAREA